MKKHGEISTNFCLNIVKERSRTFSRKVYPNKNQVTTHPDIKRRKPGIRFTHCFISLPIVLLFKLAIMA